MKFDNILKRKVPKNVLRQEVKPPPLQFLTGMPSVAIGQLDWESGLEHLQEESAATPSRHPAASQIHFFSQL